jgi:hypothetical protein
MIWFIGLMIFIILLLIFSSSKKKKNFIKEAKEIKKNFSKAIKVENGYMKTISALKNFLVNLPKNFLYFLVIFIFIRDQTKEFLKADKWPLSFSIFFYTMIYLQFDSLLRYFLAFGVTLTINSYRIMECIFF